MMTANARPGLNIAEAALGYVNKYSLGLNLNKGAASEESIKAKAIKTNFRPMVRARCVKLK
jgi:hypothetical protein